MSHSRTGERTWIDEAADRFEHDWKQGAERPRIEDFLVDQEVARRRCLLLQELLRVECELRKSKGETPTRDEYRQRFPDDRCRHRRRFRPRDSCRAAAHATRGCRHEPALRPARSSEQLHRPRRPAGRLQRLGRRQVPVPGPDSPRPRRAHTRRGTPSSQSLVAGASRSSTASTPNAAWPMSASSPMVRDGLEDRPRPRPPGQPSLSPPCWRHRWITPTATHRIAGTPKAPPPTPRDASDRPLSRPRRARRGLRRPRSAASPHRRAEAHQACDQAADKDKRARFVVEAEITGRLEHPGIVPVYGLGTYDDGRPFYAMRFIRGDNLKAAIEQFHQAEEKGRERRRAARWRCRSSCGGSSTSATPSTTPTAAACSTATSSRATSCWASSARPWSWTGAWPRAWAVPEPAPASATLDDRTLVPQSGSDLRGTELGRGWGRRPT